LRGKQIDFQRSVFIIDLFSWYHKNLFFWFFAYLQSRFFLSISKPKKQEIKMSENNDDITHISVVPTVYKYSYDKFSNLKKNQLLNKLKSLTQKQLVKLVAINQSDPKEETLSTIFNNHFIDHPLDEKIENQEHLNSENSPFYQKEGKIEKEEGELEQTDLEEELENEEKESPIKTKKKRFVDTYEDKVKKFFTELELPSFEICNDCENIVIKKTRISEETSFILPHACIHGNNA
jgi:hypothetical protein